MDNCGRAGCIALAAPDSPFCVVHGQKSGIILNAARYLNWVFMEPLDEHAAHRIPCPWDDHPHWTEQRLGRLAELSGRTPG